MTLSSLPCILDVRKTKAQHSGDGSLLCIHAPAHQTQFRSTQLRVLAEIHASPSTMSLIRTLDFPKHLKVDAKQFANGLHQKSEEEEKKKVPPRFELGLQDSES